MAHKAQMEFVASVQERLPDMFERKRVLEIGSLDVNGSFRDLFTNCEYVGVDIVDGKCVDVVCKGHEYRSDRMFDVVCSGECFEHDEYYERTLRNMLNHLEPGGLMFFTCATTGRPEHGTAQKGGALYGTSPDYYKNITEQDVRAVIDPDVWFEDYEFIVNEEAHDLYFWGK